MIDFRVPRMNDLYLNKLNKIQRCKITHHSSRAQERYILKEYGFYRIDIDKIQKSSNVNGHKKSK